MQSSISLPPLGVSLKTKTKKKRATKRVKGKTKGQALQQNLNSSTASWSSSVQSDKTTELNSSLDRLRFVALQKRIKAEWEDKTFKAKTVEKRIDRDWDEKRIEPEWEDRRVESEWEDRRASNGNSIQPEPRSQVVRSAVDANHNANLIPNSKSFKKERKIKQVNSHLPRARSESILTEEARRGKENEKPTPASSLIFDDIPIRPAKNANYEEELESSMGGMSVKSASHHSLPISSNHTSLRNQQPSMTRKTPFLRAGGGSRVKATHGTLRGAPVLAPKQALQAIQASNHVQGSYSVGTALQKIESEDWNEKVEGINMISDISKRNPQVIVDHLTQVVNAILNECKNLRSSVSRVALVCIGDLYVDLRSKMDPVLEKTVCVLMARSGDVSNAFIREDATQAIEKVVQHGSPVKLLSCIATFGAKSKNNTIRVASASLLNQLLTRVGVSSALQNGEFLARLVALLIGFAKDQTPKVRQLAKQALHSLSQDSSFDRQLHKFVSDGDYGTVKEIVADFSRKGADSLENSTASFGGLSRSGSTRRSLSRKLPDSVVADLEETKADLTASAWERRLMGLRRFEQLTTSNSGQVATNTKLIEAFIGRLSDINSKVALGAMSSYLSTLPYMARYYSSEVALKAVLNQLLFALSSHLPSKSEEHRHLAQTALEQTFAQIDSSALSSPLASVTRKANSKQRPFLLRLLTKLDDDLYRSRPKQVEVLSLPVLWHCLQSPIAEQDYKAVSSSPLQSYMKAEEQRHLNSLSGFSRGLRRLMGSKAFSEAAMAALNPSQRETLESLLR